MKLRAALALALALLPAPGIARERRERQHFADPSAVIAAELAFARLAQDKGLWTASRETGAPLAIMFLPQPTRAAEFLKGKADPAAAPKWQPHVVWSSCDGSYAVTRGAFQRVEVSGWFITIWQRQKDGAYKWVLRQEERLTAPLSAPEMISAIVADCEARQPGWRPKAATDAKAVAVPPPLDPLNAGSEDRTLSWTTQVDRAGAREFSLKLKKDGQLLEVLHASVPAPGAS